MLVQVLLLLLEVGLRAFNFKSQEPLFVDVDNLTGYLQPNPHVIHRFFPSPDMAPSVSPDTQYFLKQKPEEENDFVFESLARQHVCWLGGSRVGSEWMWDAGEAMDYTAWGVDEPTVGLNGEATDKMVLNQASGLGRSGRSTWAAMMAHGKVKDRAIVYPICEWQDASKIPAALKEKIQSE